MVVEIGFIGAGNHALHHMKEFSRLGQVRMTAVFDVFEQRARAAADRYAPMQVSESLHALLQRTDIQAVVIATPAETHLAMVRDALSTGKHILLEKPMAHTPEDALAIVRLCEQHPRQHVLVGHVERFNRAYMDARKAILENEIGTPRFISAVRLSPLRLNNPEWRLGVMDTAVHDIDLMLWMMGDAPVSVCAQGVSVNSKLAINDHVSYQVRFAGGGLAQGHIGWVDFQGGYPLGANAHPQMFIAGRHGSVQLDLWRRPVAVNNQQTGAYFWPDDVLVGYADYFTECSAQNDAFIRSITTRQPLPITPSEAYLAVKVAHVAADLAQRADPVWQSIKEEGTT